MKLNTRNKISKKEKKLRKRRVKHIKRIISKRIRVIDLQSYKHEVCEVLSLSPHTEPIIKKINSYNSIDELKTYLTINLEKKYSDLLEKRGLNILYVKIPRKKKKQIKTLTKTDEKNYRISQNMKRKLKSNDKTKRSVYLIYTPMGNKMR